MQSLTFKLLLCACIASALLSNVSSAAQSGSLLQRIDGDGGKFGSYIANIGDIDGDGFEDFAIQAKNALVYGSGFYYEGAGAIYFYSGATGNLIRSSFGTFRNMHWGGAACGVGDFDGDGLGDYALAHKWLSGNGKIFNGGVIVYSGATGAILREMYGRLDDSNLGGFVSSAGDLNGDGVHEVFTGEEDYRAGGLDNLGSVTAFDLKRGTRLWTVDGTLVDGRVGSAGSAIHDINADGHADFVANDPLGFARVYSGIDGALLLNVPEPVLGAELILADRLGDINSDGVADFLCSDDSWQSSRSAWVLSGADGSVLQQQTPDVGVLGARLSLAGIDDFDGDGFPDYGIGFYNYSIPSTGAMAKIYSGISGAVIWEDERVGEFGSAMCSLQDRNGDGLREMIICNTDFVSPPPQTYGAAYIISDKVADAPVLRLTGSCGSLFQIRVDGGSAGEMVGLAFGAPGTFVIPSGSCAGAVLDIQNPTLGGIFALDGTLGNMHLTISGVGGACGMTLQAIDLYSCLTSNTVILQ